QEVPYDPWALAEFFSKDQLERGPERIVRRHLSLHWGAGAEPRIRQAAAAAAISAQRADQPQGQSWQAASALKTRRRRQRLHPVQGLRLPVLHGPAQQFSMAAVQLRRRLLP